jgi:hypothetical protein
VGPGSELLVRPKGSAAWSFGYHRRKRPYSADVLLPPGMDGSFPWRIQMKRQKIHFSVRLDTEESLERVATRIGQALNCTFVEGEFQGWYAQVAHVLGLKISVSGVDLGGKKVARLVGAVAEEGFLYAPDGSDDVEYDRVDISAYVVDLLTIRTGLQWYRPTREDRAAEGRVVAEFDDVLGGVSSQASVTDDDKRLGE